MKKIAIIIAALALSPAVALADTTVNGKISTLGLGAEVAFPITDSIDARIGVNHYSYNFNRATTSAGVPTNYNGKLRLQSLEALADWHPWAGSFRVSGGLVYNNNNFNMTAVSNGTTVNVGGSTRAIAPGQSVNATVDFSKIVPYLGVGWGRTPKNTGLSFTSDIGILFQGSPKGNVTSNAPTVTAADKAKANADLNSSLNSFKIYPVVSIGIGYTF